MFFQSQGRAVTSNDLTAIITQQNVGIVANAWGGEEEDPPQYGKVYVTAYGAPNAGGGGISEGIETTIIRTDKREIGSFNFTNLQGSTHG